MSPWALAPGGSKGQASGRFVVTRTQKGLGARPSPLASAGSPSRASCGSQSLAPSARPEATARGRAANAIGGAPKPRVGSAVITPSGEGAGGRAITRIQAPFSAGQGPQAQATPTGTTRGSSPTSRVVVGVRVSTAGALFIAFVLAFSTAPGLAGPRGCRALGGAARPARRARAGGGKRACGGPSGGQGGAPLFGEEGAKKGQRAFRLAKIIPALISTLAKGTGICLTGPRREAKGPTVGARRGAEASGGRLLTGVFFSGAPGPTASITLASERGGGWCRLRAGR